ncbi:FAD-binding oxidoreductase [Streptomyces sp. NPDC052236]|uniref:FAD-binding oxidoreductase n=1 Tax=Streptomyces sp. NPDC052236 TaxID=3365686 RepID=UPI0037D2F016
MDRRALLTAAVAVTATACTSKGGGDARPSPTPPASVSTPASTSASASAAPDWSALGRGLDGKLIRPDDAAYPTARQLYNTRFDSLKPAAVAYIAGEDDVKECLAYARAHRVPVSIRNGGHSYAGWSSGNGRLVIDVSSLNQVARDGSVGAGAKLIDVYDSLVPDGRTIPAGSCPTVGISGLALGGGHGVTSRAYGLTCDNLTSATLVTADGRTLTASATENKDLFWALRGAGSGNFGVVTRLRFRTHPTPPTVVVGYLSWPWSKAAAALAAWQAWGPDQPDEIWSSAHLAAGPGGSTPTFSVAAFSLGSQAGLENALDRLADRAGSTARSVSVRRRGYRDAMFGYANCSTLTDAQCRLPGATPGRTPQGALQRETYAAASDFFDRELSGDGVRALMAASEAFTRIAPGEGGGAGSISLTALGGAMNRVDPLATAFVHRRSRILAQYIAAWQPGTAGGTQRAWLKDAHASMRRYASGAAYQNYVDPTLTDWRRAYYGPAADRLTRLKAEYDPDRLFNFPHAL